MPLPKKRVCKICATCGKEFEVPLSRAVQARYCSHKCSATATRAPTNVKCGSCNKEFHVPPKRLKRLKGGQIYCSPVCHAEGKKRYVLGDKNPNFRGRRCDEDGYPLVHAPHGSNLFGYGRMKLHQAVCLSILGLSSIPRGHQIHHRDCNRENNSADNLVVLSLSDHRWLHRQFGLAPLSAFCRGEVSLETLVSWADCADTARRLLPLTVLIQRDTQAFKASEPSFSLAA